MGGVNIFNSPEEKVVLVTGLEEIQDPLSTIEFVKSIFDIYKALTQFRLKIFISYRCRAGMPQFKPLDDNRQGLFYLV